MSELPTYEFHVGGLIGPVMRSALPELSAVTAGATTILTGCVNDGAEIGVLLGRLNQCGATVTSVHLSKVNESEELRVPDRRPGTPRPIDGLCSDATDASGGIESCHGGFDDDQGWLEPL